MAELTLLHASLKSSRKVPVLAEQRCRAAAAVPSGGFPSGGCPPAPIFPRLCLSCFGLHLVHLILASSYYSHEGSSPHPFRPVPFLG